MELLMFDCRYKKVKDIKKGDKIMGYDSKPVTVNNICQLATNLYEIIPTKGDNIYMSDNNTLTFKTTNMNYIAFKEEKSRNNRYIARIFYEYDVFEKSFKDKDKANEYYNEQIKMSNIVKNNDTINIPDEKIKYFYDKIKNSTREKKLNDIFNLEKQNNNVYKITNFNNIFVDKDKSGKQIYIVRLLCQFSICDKIFTIVDDKEKESYEKEAKKYLELELSNKYVVKKNNVYELTLKYYMNIDKNIKNYFLLHHVGIDFDQKTKSEIDPWILGYHLGDGTSASTDMTTADPEVVEKYKKFFESKGLIVKKKGNTKYCFSVTTGINEFIKGSNFYLNFLKNNNIINNKHIPDNFLYGSRETRLGILAGLIDSDGYNNEGYYEFVNKSTILADQVEFLCRSLGFHVTNNVTMKKSQTMKEKKGYHRLLISGNNLCDVPCILSRKEIKDRKTKKNAINHSINRINSLNNNTCYILNVTGKVLSKDFTVL